MNGEFGHNAALEYALRSRERHGAQLGGLCAHCNVTWPCEPFWIAHQVVTRLVQTTGESDSDGQDSDRQDLRETAV